MDVLVERVSDSLVKRLRGKWDLVLRSRNTYGPDFRRHRADFSDHLIGRLHPAQGCDRTVTFDRLAAGGAEGFELLR